MPGPGAVARGLSSLIIDEGIDLPSSSVYHRRFGSLLRAYTQKKLHGKNFAAARHLIEQREARGKKMHPKAFGRDCRNRRPLTSEALVCADQKEADRQKLLI